MLLLLSFAYAAPPVLLQASFSGGVGPAAVPTAAAGVSGGVGVRLPRVPLVIEVRGREMYASADARMVGGIYGDVRWPATGPYLFGGFAHHHETPLDAATEHPVDSILAIDPAIHHRTGLSAGVGWDPPAPYDQTPFLALIQPAFRIEAIVLPATGQPLAYVVGEVGLVLGVNTRRRPG